MNVAIPVWQGRISPVFDVAGQLLLVELSGGREVGRREHVLVEATADDRVERLKELGVETLICGGISQPLEMRLADRGIRVFAQVCGDAEEVLIAFMAGRLGGRRFAMPGCCGQGRRRRRGRNQGMKPQGDEAC